MRTRPLYDARVPAVIGLLITAILIALSPSTAGATVRLVKDIAPAVDRAGGGGPATMATLGNRTLFVQDDVEHGFELWITDGTPAGTRLLKDIAPGESPSGISAISVSGTTAYFRANDATHGRELWATDGTTEGTRLVKDIRPGPGDGMTTNEIVAVDGGVVFTGSTQEAGAEPWATDGTEAGTVQLVDANPGPPSSDAGNYSLAGGQVYFAATDAPTGRELWKFTGPRSAERVHDLNPGAASSSPQPVVRAGTVNFFRATTAATGTELFRTDGTSGGTELVEDLATGSDNGLDAGTPVVRVGTRVVFAASVGGDVELYSSDGTSAGTGLVANLNPTGSSFPRDLVTRGSRVFFSADDGTTGRELYSSNAILGSNETARVLDIQPGSASSNPVPMTVVGGVLLFGATEAATGRELWRTDGTGAGTRLVSDANPGTESLFPQLGGRIFATNAAADRLTFVGRDDVHGPEVWLADGTAAGTVRLTDLSFAAASSEPEDLVRFGDAVYFAATTPAAGRELWRTDGTDAGTQQVADLTPGPADSSPERMIVAGGRLFFSATGSDGRELWVLDAPGATPRIVRDINPGAASSNVAQLFARSDGLLLFRAASPAGPELWRSDGTEAGTQQVKDILPGSGGSAPTGSSSTPGSRTSERTMGSSAGSSGAPTAPAPVRSS